MKTSNRLDQRMRYNETQLRFRYKRHHVPSGYEADYAMYFPNRETFVRYLAVWNAAEPGLWAYEEIPVLRQVRSRTNGQNNSRRGGAGAHFWH